MRRSLLFCLPSSFARSHLFPRRPFFQAMCLLSMCIGLAGCAGSPASVSMASPDELSSFSEKSLCNAYDFDGSEKARSELERRGVIPGHEWGLIEADKISIGMSELGLICSWGMPSYEGGVNRTVTSSGVRKQYVYRDCCCGGCSTQYVYTRDGRVVSWQD